MQNMFLFVFIGLLRRSSKRQRLDLSQLATAPAAALLLEQGLASVTSLKIVDRFTSCKHLSKTTMSPLPCHVYNSDFSAHANVGDQIANCRHLYCLCWAFAIQTFQSCDPNCSSVQLHYTISKAVMSVTFAMS